MAYSEAHVILRFDRDHPLTMDQLRAWVQTLPGSLGICEFIPLEVRQASLAEGWVKEHEQMKVQARTMDLMFDHLIGP